MGSKSRIAKEIIPFIEPYLKKDVMYVEPFSGGCNMIDKIKHPLKLANDSHKYLIACFKELQKGWMPPKHISESEYHNIKNNIDKYKDHLVGYVGFNSFGGIWFGGYRRDKEGKRDYWREHYNHMIKQIENLKDVIFTCKDYRDLKLDNCVVYCDPPYVNVSKYKGTMFDTNDFWKWVHKIKNNNIVFVSEYTAPDMYKCIWQKEINSFSKISKNKPIEKLFLCN